MLAEHATIEALSALIDGELADDERTGLEAHLNDCPPCQEELRQLRRSVELVRALPLATPPRSFRLAADVHGRAADRWWRRPGPLRTLAGMAAALTLVLFVADVAQPAPRSPALRSVAPVSAPLQEQTVEQQAAPAEGRASGGSAPMAPADAARSAAAPAAAALPPSAGFQAQESAKSEMADATTQRAARQGVASPAPTNLVAAADRGPSPSSLDSVSPGPFSALRLTAIGAGLVSIILGLASIWTARRSP